MKIFRLCLPLLFFLVPACALPPAMPAVSTAVPDARLGSLDVVWLKDVASRELEVSDLAARWPAELCLAASRLDSSGEYDLALDLWARVMQTRTGWPARLAARRWVDRLAERGRWMVLAEQRALVYGVVLAAHYPAYAERSLAAELPDAAANAALVKASDQDGVWAMDLLALTGFALYQGGHHGELRQLAQWTALWRKAETYSERPALLVHPDSPLIDLFDALVELAARGKDGDRHTFARLLRHAADKELALLGRELVLYRSMVDEARKVLSSLFDRPLLQLEDPLAGFERGQEIASLLQFKTRVAERQGKAALELWEASFGSSGPGPFTLWRAALNIPDDRQFAGILRDLHDAARQAGEQEKVAELLVGYAASLDNMGKAYALELAARLLREKKPGKEVARLFRQSFAITRKLGAPADSDRLRWYCLRELASEAKPDLDAIAALLEGIDNPDYYADQYESMVLRLIGGERWTELEELYTSHRKFLSAGQSAKIATVLGRALQLRHGRKPTRDLEKRYKGYLEQAWQQRTSLYYHAMAAYFLGKPVLFQEVLDAQARRGSVSGPFTPRLSKDSLAQGEMALAAGLVDWAAPEISALRRTLGPAELLRLSGLLSTAGSAFHSVRMAEYYRGLYGHPAGKDALKLMYPRPFADVVEKETERRKVPVYLQYSLLRTESLFDHRAVSPVGARGIAQFMPATAAATARAMKLDSWDVNDPAVAIAMSAYHLQELQRSMKNWSKVLGAYNAGGTKIRRHAKLLPDDQFLFNEGLSISETRNYIRRIVESSIIYDCLYSEKPDTVRLVRDYLGGA